MTEDSRVLQLRCKLPTLKQIPQHGVCYSVLQNTQCVESIAVYLQPASPTFAPQPHSRCLSVSRFSPTEKIQRGQATIGKYDGKHAALTCATTAGKIFLHQPHLQSHGEEQLTYLNINKQITALVAGLLSDVQAKDVLLVGRRLCWAV